MSCCCACVFEVRIEIHAPITRNKDYAFCFNSYLIIIIKVWVSCVVRDIVLTWYLIDLIMLAYKKHSYMKKILHLSIYLTVHSLCILISAYLHIPLLISFYYPILLTYLLPSHLLAELSLHLTFYSYLCSHARTFVHA